MATTVHVLFVLLALLATGIGNISQSRAVLHSVAWPPFVYVGQAVATERNLGVGAQSPQQAPGAAKAVLTRGPYLQLGTPTSIVVRWRTDRATPSQVRYGPASDDLVWTVTDPMNTTEHEIVLAGLSPNKSYYYAVGTGAELLAGGPGYFFVTPPTPGTPKAMRIWVLGDSGTGDFNSAEVRDAYYRFTGQRHTDLWLMLGDNAYESGTDLEYQNKLFDIYPDMLRKSVLWPTLGNHDGLSARSATQSGPYFDVFTLPTAGEAGGAASGTEAYYSFDYANIHFVSVDSEDMMWEDLDGLKRWLRADLAGTQQRWIIAYWHHPPYTRGKYNSDIALESTRVRSEIVPLLEAYGVDLVLSGHSHSYERSYLLDGHHGVASTLTAEMLVDQRDGRVHGAGAYVKAAGPRQGTVYVVAGSSGMVQSGPMNHPAMAVSLLRLGSCVIDIDGDRLDAVFLDNSGRVADEFTIIKDSALPATRQDLVVRNAAWKYNATGGNLGTTWADPNADDASWPIGVAPLGYGEPYIVTAVPFGPNPARKYITAYFRKDFQVAGDPTRIGGLRLEANYDDGFVAYLNGVEVARRGLPDGVVTFDMLAAEHEGGAYETIDITDAIGVLLPGRNVLAVEVHQAWPGSSDLVMDVALSYTTARTETPTATATPTATLIATATTTPPATTTRTATPTPRPPGRAIFLPVITRP